MEDLSFPSINTNELMEPDNNFKNFRRNESSDIREPRRKPKIRKMYIAALAALSLYLAMGLSTGYSAPATYDMQIRTNSAIHPSEEEITWIASILALGLVIGSLFAGTMSDKIGRKDTLMLNIIPFGAGWLMICYATSVPEIIIGRFFCGFACGIINTAGALYCVEISTAEVRGILGVGCQGFLVIGNLLSNIVGAFISWRYLALHGAAVATLGTICFYPMPETPRWLLAKGRLQEAIRVMDDLQGGFVDAEKECNAIYKDLKDEPKGNLTFEEWKHPAVYKPAIIGIWITIFMECSGANSVFLYSSSIFTVAKVFMDPKYATIVLGSVQVVATLLGNSVIERLGRKILLILSGALMGLTLATLGIFYYKSTSDVVFQSNFGWLPLTSLIIFVIGYSLGYGPIPRLIVAELVPTRARSTVNGMVNIFNGLSAFVIIKTFSEFEDLLTKQGTFWLYSSVCAVGVVYVIFSVPETKGKKLEEIEKIFQKPKDHGRVIDISVIS